MCQHGARSVDTMKKAKKLLRIVAILVRSLTSQSCSGAAEGSSFWGGKSVKHTPTSLILVHTILCSCTFARTDKNHGKYKKSTDEQNCQNICFFPLLPR